MTTIASDTQSSVDPIAASDVALSDVMRRRLLLILIGAAIAALVCGLFVHPNGLVWLVALTLVLAIGVAWPWVSVRSLSARLEFDRDRGREGQAVTATLTLRTRLPWPSVGLRLEGDAGISAGAVEFVARRSGEAIHLELHPTRFGELPAYPMSITCGVPFGLWRAGREITIVRSALVWPKTTPAGPVPEVEGGAIGVHAGRRVGTGGEPCGVRNFRDGDRLRQVHWAQSAKHDRLVVRETLSDTTPCVRVGLVTSRCSYAGAADFDAAVRRAASLVEGWTRSGSVVELVIDQFRLRCPPNALPRAALDRLSRLRFENLSETAPPPTGTDVLVGAAGGKK